MFDPYGDAEASRYDNPVAWKGWVARTGWSSPRL